MEGVLVDNSRPLDFVLPSDPTKTAVLMIDFQGDFCDEEKGFVAVMGGESKENREALVGGSKVLDAARRNGVRVIHTIEATRVDKMDLSLSKFRRSRTDPSVPVIGEDFGRGLLLTRGSECNGLRDEVAYVDGEVALHKPGKGAFCDTELRAWLDYFETRCLVFCGVTTECCVQTTMREANDRGFDSLLIEDATASCVSSMKAETVRQISAFGAIVGCVARADDVVAAFDRLKPSPPRAPSLQTIDIIDVSSLARLAAAEMPRDVRGLVDAEMLRCSQAIDRACRHVGFFYVVGHGIDDSKILSCARDFFSLDIDAKTSVKAGGGEGAGYEPSGAQVLDEGRLGKGIDGTATHLADQKESYIVGKSLPSERTVERIDARWPDQDLLSGYDFKQTLINYHDATELFIGRVLLRAIALGLGLAADTFDFCTKDAMTKLRLLAYPPAAAENTDDDEKEKNAAAVAPGCGSHTDWGALTVIAQDDVGGLEVCVAPDDWREAPKVKDALLVNVGDMLTLWTSGRYRSAPHRVLKAKTPGKPRYSAAVFYNCDHDAKIDPRMLMPNVSKGLEKDAKILTAEEYILERVKGTYGG